MCRLRRRVGVGVPDPSLTPVSGMVAVTELADRLNMIRLLDAAIGPIKACGRGFTGGQLLVGVAAAQLAGEDFLVGLDRQRADLAGQVPAPAVVEAAADRLGSIRPQVAGLLRSGKLVEAAKLVDDVLLVGELGMSRGDVRVLRDAHAALTARRVARGARGTD